MDDDIKHYARLSDLSYVRGTNYNRRQYLRDNKLNYDVDTDLSDEHHVIAVDKNDPSKVVMSIRGSQDKHDLGTDIMIALGLKNATRRFRDSDKKMQKVIDKYGKDNITISGHSLGGSIGSYLAKKHDVDAYLYNTGSSPHLTSDVIAERIIDNRRKRTADINYVNVANDPLSQGTSYLVGEGDRHHFVEQTQSNPHTISNFY